MENFVCEKCLARVSEDQEERKKYIGSPSLGFFHNISLQLHFPFQAIALLIDCANSRKATKFCIRIVKMQNQSDMDLSPQASYEQNYIQIKFDGNTLTNTEAHKISCFEPLPDFNFSFYCRLGMLGLGKTSMIICNDGKYKKTILFSVDDRINPIYSKSSGGYLCIEELTTGKIENPEGEHQKKIITQICKIFHVDTNLLFECQVGEFKMLVFHGKIFVTSKKLMFYELSESQFNRDIQIYHNAYKIQFLDKLGYELANHAEISFASYYSLLYLHPTIKLIIGNSQQEFHGLNYQAYLQTLQKNGMISQIQCSPQGTQKCILYKAKQNYFAHNNGILLYSRGRLINRYETEFGKMLQQRFYKKKYRKPPKNFFPFLGIIQFNSDIQPNLILNNFSCSSSLFQRFILKLNEILYEDEEMKPQKSNIIIDEDVRVTRSLFKQSQKDRRQENVHSSKKGQKDEEQYIYGEPRKKTKLQNK